MDKPQPRNYHRDAADDAAIEYQEAQERADSKFNQAKSGAAYLRAQAAADRAYRQFIQALRKRHSAEQEAA